MQTTESKIVEHLHKGPYRFTAKEIAKDLGLNLGTVSGKLSKLKKEKYLFHDIHYGTWWVPYSGGRHVI
jgi:response regulator of citrate/malate metabolism